MMMNEQTNGQGQNGGGQETGKTAQATQPPRLSIQSQYIKDLSFENPKPNRQLQGQELRPEIQIKVDVRAKPVQGELYEVELELDVNAKAGEETVFVLELVYGSVFAIANIPQESLQPLLMIECPRLIFPFARRIVADMTRDGGFPPLLIDPIDFVALFKRRAQQAAAQATSPKQEEETQE
jgi:preprotein translocase subunit SecB